MFCMAGVGNAGTNTRKSTAGLWGRFTTKRILFCVVYGILMIVG